MNNYTTCLKKAFKKIARVFQACSVMADRQILMVFFNSFPFSRSNSSNFSELFIETRKYCGGNFC